MVFALQIENRASDRSNRSREIFQWRNLYKSSELVTKWVRINRLPILEWYEEEAWSLLSKNEEDENSYK